MVTCRRRGAAPHRPHRTEQGGDRAVARADAIADGSVVAPVSSSGLSSGGRIAQVEVALSTGQTCGAVELPPSRRPAPTPRSLLAVDCQGQRKGRHLTLSQIDAKLYQG